MAENNVEFKSLIDEVNAKTEESIRRALEECGLVAVGHSKEYCPWDTGNLRGSITHEVVTDTEVQVGTHVEYAPYVEFNEKARHQAPSSAHYLKKALANHRDEYEKIFLKELKKLT